MKHDFFVAAGLPRSGSTWSANVMLACLRAAGSAQTPFVRRYADEIHDDLARQIAAGSAVILKSHFPAASLCLFTELGHARCVVTIRSPYDCVFSLMERFGYDFGNALNSVRQSIQRLLPMLTSREVLVLRYEDDITKDPEVVLEIARHLGIESNEMTATEILTDHSAVAIRERLAQLRDSGTFTGASARDEIERGTEWHFDHLGKGDVGGAMANLRPGEIATISHLLRKELVDLGYPTIGRTPPLVIPAVIDMSLAGGGVSYLDDGFDVVEEWGVWISQKEAMMTIPLAEVPKHDLVVELGLRLAPAFTGATSAACHVAVNNRHYFTLHGVTSGGAFTRISLAVPRSAILHAALEISLSLDGVQSPAELGVGPDTRTIGVGINLVVIRPPN